VGVRTQEGEDVVGGYWPKEGEVNLLVELRLLLPMV
jgi:hypothetical protein